MKKGVKKAFTLIELIIVVVIVGILAMVAIPRYFANVEKARRAEAYATMRSIREAIMGYYAATALYPAGTFPITVTVDNDAIMVVGQPGSRSFTYSYSATTISAAPGPGSCTYNMTVASGALAANGTGCSA
jgi:prepilin-type N-terminal cleavage/methylation domain-containing protein